MTDTLLIILIVLAVIILGGLVFLIVRKKPSGASIDTNSLKEDIMNSLNQNIFNLGQSLSKSMVENANSSAISIGDLRVKVNEQLEEFKEKLNGKLQEEFKTLNENVDKKMSGINDRVEDRLKNGFETTNQTFLTIKERMAVMETAQQKIENLSTEMLGLQNILTNNQQRGAFGEYQLEQILHSTFGENPALYQMQYEIKNPKEKDKVRVDSAIFMPNGIICIDSKFPYSNYARLFNERLSDSEETQIIRQLRSDIKKHIDAISSKYIVAGVTSDFAVMFLPSDGILALIHMKLQDTIEYARDKKVVIVSPTIIVPLIASYKIVKIDYERSQHAKEITDQLNQLSKDFDRFADRWNKLSVSIGKINEQSNDVGITVRKISTKFGQLKNSEVVEEIVEEKD